ncbi:phasin family protein [Janthinobacterium psychrotolerans]|uniref:Phasin family protein n=1 Tax=Janthinobacterium psychrotolerans TaxID=1747903 RepID=A0A1A7C277_9BURK|nr:phasin family protein [Janthinobacterium psychrotolerans]OBV39837.1 phasin family protein [Janthinobacterium psychrotolerans]
MFPLPQQLSSAAKSQWETQLQLFSTFGHTVFDGAEKIIALHLGASKAAIARSTGTAQHLLAVNDAREFLSYSTSQAQPGIESVLAYSRELFGIASRTQAQLLEAAKARLDHASPAADTAAAPANTTAQVEVEAVIEVPAAVSAPEAEPAPASEPASEPESAPAPAAVLAPVAEPSPAAPAPLPLAATLPIAASAPAAIAAPPAKVPAAVKATAKAAPVASKPANKQGGPSKAAIQPAAKGKRK